MYDSPRKFFVFALIFLIGVINIYSAVNKNVPANLQFTNEKLRNLIIQKNSFIYQNTDPEFYFHNVIQVKVKNDTELALLAKKQLGDYFNQIIKTDKIKSVEAPYKQYFPGMLQSKDKRGLGRIYEIRFNNNIDPYQISKDLMANSNVEYATPIFKRHTTGFTPNDPYLFQQYAMTVMHMEDAWEVSQGDTNIVIAIIDSGTDWNHEDLAANIWINHNEIPDNKIDDDLNGKEDDYHGWDLIGDISVNDYYNSKWIEDNNPSNSGNDHGTFTAGCASAVTNNAKGIAGTGFKCKIMPIKCAADNAQLAGSIIRGYDGILYAAQNGADVINCSWGGPGGSPFEQDIINTAADLGAVIVVSSGNDGRFSDEFKTYPANYDNVINAGASTSTDAPANFSNYGNEVTVFAPGQGILSTKFNSKYTSEDGTSFSSPILAGIVGLMKAVYKDWTPQQFKMQLRSTSDRNMTGTAGYEQYFIGRANAYKAVTYNNPAFPDKVMPGIYGENLQVKNSISKLDNFNLNKVTVDLKNYLGVANDLKISITPIDTYIENTTKEILISKPINTNESATIEIEVKLKPETPWYQGTAKVLLKYETGDYIDYQVINIPVFLPTDNRYTQSREYDISSGLIFYGGSLPDKNTAWLVGYSAQIGTLLYRKSQTEFNNVIANDPIYCIHAFDGDRAIAAASPTSKMTKLYTTTNGGQNWTSSPINTITPFANHIHFYNDNEGILLGDPINNAWGNAKTIDGGNTWSMIKNMPAPYTNETGYVESIAFYNNKIWFGTSQGRIYYSENKGDTWSVSTATLGSSLSKMTFLSDLVGFAVYTVGTGQTAQQLLGTTLDGGKTWTAGIYEFTKNLIGVAEIHAVPDAGKVVILATDNRVFESADYGTTWKPVLTKKMYGVNNGIAFNDGIGVRLWSSGSAGIGYLDFKLTPTSASKRIAVISENPVNFGDVNVNSSKINKVEIRNSGNVDLKIASATLVLGNGVDPAEIKMLSQPATDLQPLESTVFNVMFKPLSAGLKTASIIIKSDADPTELTIDLVGTGKPVTSVNEINSESASISISPVPAGDFLNIDYVSAVDGKYTIDIFDLSGNRLFELPANFALGSNNLSINIKSLTSGTYILTIKNDKKIETKKFVK